MLQIEIDVSGYIEKIQKSMEGLEGPLKKAFKHLAQAKESGRRVWILGNGGSLAIAQHFAQDLVKLVGMRAHTINCPSFLTAYTNDDGFEFSYSNPLDKLADPEDVVVIFSCSGKSRNYWQLVNSDPEKRRKIISVVGTDGGFLATNSEVSIHIKSDDYQVCETAFCVVADVLAKSLMGA